MKHTPEAIEAALSRLMPPALSGSGQRAIEAMLDELAATTPIAAVPQQARRPAWRRFIAPASLAAALALAVGLALKSTPTPAAPFAAVEPTPGMVLVSSSDSVEDIADAGWVGNPEGDAMQAVRYRVIESSTLRDEATGMEVVVSDPREETVFAPVTMF